MSFNYEKFPVGEVGRRELPFQQLPRQYENAIIIKNERDSKQQLFIRVRGTNSTVISDFLKQLRVTRFEVVAARPEDMRIERVDEPQPRPEPPAERIGGFSAREVEVRYSLIQAGDVKAPYRVYLDIDPPIKAGWKHINILNGRSTGASVTVTAGGPQTAVLYRITPWYKEDRMPGLNVGNNPQLTLSAENQAASFFVQIIEGNQDGSYELSVSCTLLDVTGPGE